MKYPKEYLEEIKLRLKVSHVVGKIVKLKSHEVKWYEKCDLVSSSTCVYIESHQLSRKNSGFTAVRA